MNSRTVLITGATSGIGFALYEKYTAQGDNVIACGRDKHKLQKLCAKAFKTIVFDMTMRRGGGITLNHLCRITGGSAAAAVAIAWAAGGRRWRWTCWTRRMRPAGAQPAAIRGGRGYVILVYTRSQNVYYI